MIIFKTVLAGTQQDNGNVCKGVSSFLKPKKVM